MESILSKVLHASLFLVLVALFLLLPGCPLTETETGLVNGAVYEVEIQVLDDGTLYAVEIEPSDDSEADEDDDADEEEDGDTDEEADGDDDEDGEEVESGFSVQIDAIAADRTSFTVFGSLTVVLEAEEGEVDEEGLQMTDLTVGMWIEAEGEYGADGIFYAEEIEAADEEEIEIEAVLGNLTDTTFAMLGLTINYDSGTAIDGEEEEEGEEDDEEDDDDCEQEGENEDEC